MSVHEDATQTMIEYAKENDIKNQIIELNTREDVIKLFHSPYGVFDAVFNVKLLRYHYQLKKDLPKLISFV